MGRVTTAQYGDQLIGESVRVRNKDEVQPRELAETWYKIGKNLRAVADQLYDHSHPVDEYECTEQNGSVGSLEVLPEFDIADELIQSIIVGAPAASLCTLQLGNRYIPIVMPASAVFVFPGPMGIRLKRNERRILTSATPGQLWLELMGYADVGRQ